MRCGSGFPCCVAWFILLRFALPRLVGSLRRELAISTGSCWGVIISDIDPFLCLVGWVRVVGWLPVVAICLVVGRGILYSRSLPGRSAVEVSSAEWDIPG